MMKDGYLIFVGLVVVICCSLNAADGFALRLYPTTFGDDETLPNAAQGSYRKLTSSTISTPPTKMTPMRRTTQRPDFLNNCGDYGQCKQALIAYLERVLEMKKWLDAQSKLMTARSIWSKFRDDASAAGTSQKRIIR